MNRLEELLARVQASTREQLVKDVLSTGLSTSSGLNFYYLEEQAKNIYPVFYPLLASVPRVSPMFRGQKVGGTAVNWKAIVGIDQGGYPAISEGNRNAFMKFKERDYAANFRFLGKDTEVSFQAEQTGLGFDDNIALAQLALLNALLNDEERMILYGNSGTGGNGYALGTTPTPVIALNTDSVAGLPAGDIAVFCIALTPWGVQMATATGVQPPFVRTNADSSQDTINGGTAACSLVSNGVTADSTHTSVTATVAAVNGAVGYAWYISVNASPTTANAFFSKVTAGRVASLNSYVNTNQLANVTGLNTDASFNTLDFDGLLTWGFGTSAAAQPAYLKDLAGGGFTANGDGTIKEFEDCLDFLWQNYKITVDKIYLGGSLISSVSRAILGSSTGGAAASRLFFESDAAGRLVGGTKVVQYRSKYSNSGAAKVVDVATHPWLPDGVVYFDLVNNPYPAAGNAIPSVRRIVDLEDHFSIKWPYRKLQHELGVYCFETLQHYIPFGMGIIVGAANKVNA
jgi:hypothetical protein